MHVSFSNQIHWKSSWRNPFEEYCAVLPQICGKKIKHYKEVEKRAVAVTPEKGDWKETVKKIGVLLSHLTLVVPLVMYLGKAIQRAVKNLKITVALEKRQPEHAEVAQEIRKLREDSHYVPPDIKGFRHALRLKVPADSILDELYPEPPNEKPKDLFFNMKFYRRNPLKADLRKKQEKILSEGFNGFYCVHGVEDMKGGIRNILNMMIEGVVRAPYTGGLMEGMPEFVAGPHGPFYVILRTGIDNEVYQKHGLWTEKAQAAFLVPSDENRVYLEKGLTKAVERGYITEEEKDQALKKVITYDEFIALPWHLRRSETLLRAHLLTRII